MNKKQVLIIHGGTTFDSSLEYEKYLLTKEISIERMRPAVDWKYNLQSDLGIEYDVFTPSMPNKDNASYAQWKIIFEKILEKLDEEIILVGHSLGGIFLAQYLSENKIQNKVKQLHLVASPFDAKDLDESLGDFNLNTELLKNIEVIDDNIFIYHSTDDPIVSYSHSQKYASHVPKSKICKLEDRKHIWQEYFPELVENIMRINNSDNS